MSNIKKVLGLGLIILSLAFAVGVSAPKAEAVSVCTATATGAWDGVAGDSGSGGATFSGCSTAYPDTGDTLVINTGVILTISGTAQVAGVTINDPVASSNGITVSGGTFTSGPIVFAGSSGAGNSTITLGANNLVATNITIAGGASTGTSSVTSTTGAITASGTTGIAFSGTAARAVLTKTGAGVITLSGSTGTIGTGGTVNLNAASTVTFSGTGAQPINAYTYGILTLAKASGASTISTGTVVAAGTTTVGATSALTVSSGATATLAALTTTTTGTVTNNGTLTASGTITLGNGSTLTNGGTLTASGTVTGASATLVNTGTLNLGGATTNALIIGTLTAGTAGTINYNLAAAQTVKTGTYYNLTLSGGSSAVKTFSAAETVANNLTIAASTSVDLTGTSTAKYLIFNGVRQLSGSWGFTGATATHINAVYISAAAGGAGSRITASYGPTNVAVIVASPSNSSHVSSSSSSDTEEDTATAATVKTPTPTLTLLVCPPGVLFDAATGERCNVTLADVSCPNQGQMFRAEDGKKCTAWGAAAHAAAYNFGTVTLKSGSTGAAVMELQRFLNAKLMLGLVVDGKLGPKTIAVIKKWQMDNGLVADGLIGAKTKAKMNAEAGN